MAARVNLIIDQGSTFYQEFQLKDENDDSLVVNEANGNFLYESDAQMRKSYHSTNSVSFDTALSNGMLILTLTSNTTAEIVAGRYVYDAKLVSANDVNRIIEGIVTVKPEATR